MDKTPSEMSCMTSKNNHTPQYFQLKIHFLTFKLKNYENFKYPFNDSLRLGSFCN
jgi:hypothetical protein